MKLTYKKLDELCSKLAGEIANVIPGSIALPGPGGRREWRAFAIPRGGIFAGLALAKYLNLQLTTNPTEADFFIDDIIDSGDTMAKWCDEYPGIPFFALLDRKTDGIEGWVEFPWEASEKVAPDAGETIEMNVTRILQYIGENPERQGLIETPHRVAKAWKNYWAAGYSVNIASLFKSFEDGAEDVSQMVMVKSIPFYSHCEHHLAPFFGTVTIAYLPRKRILGLSKLSRVAKAFAQRLQVQERLTNQIADAILQHLDPIGVGVFIKARHLCMESRGIEQQGHHTETTALRGVFLSDPAVRQEFLARL